MKLFKLVGRLVAMGCLVFLITEPSPANNVRVTNIALTQQDTGTKTVNVTFDLAWNNSWRDAENWDAAWIFVKFRAPGSNDWQHATLSTNSADHKPAANSTITTVPDGKGVFVYSSSGYTGDVYYAQMKLSWHYGTNGYSFAKGDLVEVSAHAIEMVCIPAGAFYLGSGGSEVSHFYQYTDGSQSTNPYLVSSEAAITVGTGNGNLYYASTTYGGDQSGPISNVFPKGYSAYYCMKYEVSQGQYAEFLNKLTATQDASRFPNKSGSNRHTIGGTTTNRSASAPDRACNWLSWADGVAYSDWAALRPLTELEFEKACRGPAYPMPNEYAWGSTVITQLTAEAGGSGSGTETPEPATANACYNNAAGIQGPTRAGLFARATSNRQAAGASYYGVMEMSGNLLERPVSVGNAAGRIFQGSVGDGVLDANGNATGNPDWPSSATAAGSGHRGGHWYNATGDLMCSDRYVTTYAVSTRHTAQGWRAARQAP